MDVFVIALCGFLMYKLLRYSGTPHSGIPQYFFCIFVLFGKDDGDDDDDDDDNDV